MKRRTETGILHGKPVTILTPETPEEARKLEADPNVDSDLGLGDRRKKRQTPVAR